MEAISFNFREISYDFRDHPIVGKAQLNGQLNKTLLPNW